MKPYLAAWLMGASMIGLSASARAADVPATPDNYRSLVGSLRAGDTLRLSPGTYTTLAITGLQGTASAPIVIEGPPTGPSAVVQANANGCCNVIEIRNSSFVVLRNLTVDGGMVDGAFGVSAKDNLANLVHHITLEGNTFRNFSTTQSNVAISTKTPTWGWIIRRNRILDAGTGLYLGNSNGAAPFIGGVIENNLVQNPIGYGMEIKWQSPRPVVAGMPTTPETTIIRHNVFIKNDQPSPSGDRPNLLVGGFPTSGPGSEDRYQIYGNLFVHNPRESLLQASGRVSIHDNIFVDTARSAIALQNHDLPLVQAHVYNNTIHAAAKGIVVSSAPPEGASVVGNLVFSASPISGSIADNRDNITGPVSLAPQYVKMPSVAWGVMDFYPLPGKVRGAPLDLSKFRSDADHALDFNGHRKADESFRGAYAGEGDNPGWKLAADVKDLAAASQPGASEAGGESQAASGASSNHDPSAAPAARDGDAGASGCAVRKRASGDAVMAGLLGIVAACAARRRRR